MASFSAPVNVNRDAQAAGQTLFCQGDENRNCLKDFVRVAAVVAALAIVAFAFFAYPIVPALLIAGAVTLVLTAALCALADRASVVIPVSTYDAPFVPIVHHHRSWWHPVTWLPSFGRHRHHHHYDHHHDHRPLHVPHGGLVTSMPDGPHVVPGGRLPTHAPARPALVVPGHARRDHGHVHFRPFNSANTIPRSGVAFGTHHHVLPGSGVGHPHRHR